MRRPQSEWLNDVTVETRLPMVLVATVAAAIACAIVVAAIAQSDVVVSGRGVFVPRGESARVESVTAGRVVAVLHGDGDQVAVNDVIVQLDSTQEEAHVSALAQEVAAAERRVDVARNALEENEHLGQTEITVAEGERRKLAAAATASRQEAIAARAEAVSRADRATRVEALAKSGLVPPQDVEDARASLEESARRAEAALARSQQAQTEAVTGSENSRRVDAANRVAQLDRRAALEEEIEKVASLRRDLTAATIAVEQSRLRAPRAGTVTGLAVHNVGETVRAGEVVAWIVPEHEPLRLAVDIGADAIGLVTLGQPARFKIDSYPFQEYGVGTGRVVRISPDAVGRDPQQRTRLYRVDVEIDALPHVRGVPLPLRPGMSAQADLFVRRVRVLTALLRPAGSAVDNFTHVQTAHLPEK